MVPIKLEHGLRGEYDNMRADYTVAQDMAGYSPDDHAVWRLLYRRQKALLPRYACRECVEALAALDVGERIPDLERISGQLQRATGWRLVAVPGLIPTDVFFEHLAARRFPVTVWIRRRSELDYLVEPDLFHDFFGHVPLLLNPVFADYMQAYGRKGPEAIAHGALDRLSRLYWYLVEFGLLRTREDGLRAFGAGILSSRAELRYAIESPRPNRLRFDPERVMRTAYRIDAFQETYFVLDGFEELFDATRRDFLPIYERLEACQEIPAHAVIPGDTVLHRGTDAAPDAA